MKLQVQKGKQKEFVQTFEKSTSTFQNLTVEFLKLAFKVKEDEEKLYLNQQKVEKANLLTLEIAQKAIFKRMQIQSCKQKILKKKKINQEQKSLDLLIKKSYKIKINSSKINGEN